MTSMLHSMSTWAALLTGLAPRVGGIRLGRVCMSGVRVGKLCVGKLHVGKLLVGGAHGGIQAMSQVTYACSVAC